MKALIVITLSVQFGIHKKTIPVQKYNNKFNRKSPLLNCRISRI